MRTTPFTYVLLAALALTVGGCGDGGSGKAPLQSGTYSGTIQEVNASEREIYVERDDGRVLELYFTDGTDLTKNDEEAAFSTLSTGQSVEVELKIDDGEPTPLRVRILEQNTSGGY